MDNLIQDIRYGLRLLLKSPGFTIVAVLTLALGIGANTAIFSVVNAVLLKPLPYQEPDRLVQFWESNPIKGWTQNVVAPANFLDWQKQTESYEEMAAYIGSDTKDAGLSDIHLTGSSEPERVKGLFVTGNIFSVLGVNAAMGRTLIDEETWIGKDPVVVLSDGLWRRRFAADPNIVGTRVSLNGRDYEVVGVMPRSFYFPSRDVELWLPTGWDYSRIYALRRPHFLRAIARLKSGVSMNQAQSELTAVASRLEQEHPDTNTQMGAGLGPLHDWIVSDTRPALLIFLGAVVLVLLIACANVANLMLARATVRAKEMAIRSAIGARRTRIVRQLLIESLILSFIGGGIGLIIAVWGMKLLLAINPGAIPRINEVKLDEKVLLFAFVVCVLTSLLFGLAPALHISKPDLALTLKEGGQKGAAGSRGARARNALVVAEIALSLLLIVGAGLMVRSFIRLQQVDPGFVPAHLLTFKLSLPGARYQDNKQTSAFFKQFLERTGQLPGTRSVAGTTMLALKGYNWTSDFTVEGRPPEEYGKEVRHKEITPDYFNAMSIPLTAGRFFNDADNETSQQVLIINEALARRHFINEDPIGKRLKFSRPEVDGQWRRIVGVVRDEKQDGLRAETRPEIYQPWLQNAPRSMTIVVRTDGPPASVWGGIRGVIAELDRDLPMYDMQTGEEVVYASLERDRFAVVLLGVFAVAALLLASIGIYGLMSYSVQQRTHEMGIRLALGARSRDVIALILGSGLKVVLVGIGIGAASAYWLTRLMASLLFGIGATDPITFCGVAVALGLIALLACYFPARRSAKVDPLIALRCD